MFKNFIFITGLLLHLSLYSFFQSLVFIYFDRAILHTADLFSTYPLVYLTFLLVCLFSSIRRTTFCNACYPFVTCPYQINLFCSVYRVRFIYSHSFSWFPHCWFYPLILETLTASHFQELHLRCIDSFCVYFLHNFRHHKPLCFVLWWYIFPF